MKELISATIKKRKDWQKEEREAFTDKEVEGFRAKIRRLLKTGAKENEKSDNKYAAPFEKAVLERIQKYQDNYFRWMEDFRLLTTDNLSERGLRNIKSI